MSRDDLVAALEMIGWKLKSKMNGHHHRMQDHKGNNSKIMLLPDGTCFRDEEAEIYFYYKDCEIEYLGNNCISLYARNNKSVFINFYGEDTTSHPKERI